MALVLNELLCYMLAKIDSVPTDTLTRLVDENFSEDEVDAAKSLLCHHVEESIRAGKKRGQHKKKNSLDDIVKMIIQCDRSSLPKFVAHDLKKLPPISIDCIDVSSLLRKQQLQDVELANLKDLVHDILLVTAETSKRLEVSLLASSRDASDSPSSSLSGRRTPLSAAPGDSAASDSSDSPGSPAASAFSAVPAVSFSSVDPAAASADHAQAAPSRSTSAPTYSEVLRDASSGADSGRWRTANRKKSAKTPASKSSTTGSAKGPADAAPNAAPDSAARHQQSKMRPTNNKAVVGSKKAGPITAVTVVKRVSMFMSRLPPGTGAEAVREYVLEQTGASDVTATKLKTRYDSYESYRLDIVGPMCDILDPEIWGQGLIVRRFFSRRASPERAMSADTASV